MVLSFTFLSLLIGTIWLIVLTFLLWKITRQYNTLSDGGSKNSIPAILESFSKDIHVSKKHLAELQEKYDRIEKEGKIHIQKVGLLRFNPFKDTGGDQSFILALVDAQDTGIVISGLYSRSGTRWYAKRIVEGKGHEYELSEEEKKALKLAKASA